MWGPRPRFGSAKATARENPDRGPMKNVYRARCRRLLAIVNWRQARQVERPRTRGARRQKPHQPRWISHVAEQNEQTPESWAGVVRRSRASHQMEIPRQSETRTVVQKKKRLITDCVIASRDVHEERRFRVSTAVSRPTRARLTFRPRQTVQPSLGWR